MDSPPPYNDALNHVTVRTGWVHEPPSYSEHAALPPAYADHTSSPPSYSEHAALPPPAYADHTSSPPSYSEQLAPPNYEESSNPFVDQSQPPPRYAPQSVVSPPIYTDPDLRMYPAPKMPVPVGRSELEALWSSSGPITDNSPTSLALKDSGLETRQTNNGFILVRSQGLPDYVSQNASGGSLVKNNWRGYSRSGRWDGNPNQCIVQDFLYCFNLRPNPITSSSPIETPLGPIGIALNGIPLYNWKTSGERDAIQIESFDLCAGHPDSKGRYHYHQFPRCVKSASSLGRQASQVLAHAANYGQNPWSAKPLADALRQQIQSAQPSAPVGILFDSCLLYGPVGVGAGGPVRLLRSSYVNGRYQQNAGDLDECNGAIGPDGIYRYYCTVTLEGDDVKPTFPYLPPKYRSTPEPRNFPPHALRAMGIQFGPHGGTGIFGGANWWGGTPGSSSWF